MGSSYDDPEQFARWYYEDKHRLAQVESVIVEERAIEVLLDEAQVTDKALSFEEFMRPPARALATPENADS